ncbi:LysR family transcriptional regulator [Gluconacetobacter tumulisoli]|uniref:LysR family transcriptional regulator n=1 Tax=Gluconacetobacter tumulisoli TaxID=1286189 RepID=A0A7W4K5L9_9PROT|nr:LysR family transcriptional regulator [Gluconacetobacter tumulisoli]MBB2200672.1 LysR family transcriptional regulator [Gluconacetobacter tumulisoli]
MDLLAHIRVFIDIAEQGSLAAVARARRLAPSAVTASLRRLEDHVGARLVLRSTRKLALTPEGERFARQCRGVLLALDEAVDQAAGDGPLKGTIRVTSLNDFGRTRLCGLIDGFLARHPAVRFDLSLSDDVVDLIHGGYDLGLRTGPLSDSRLKARLILRGGRSVCAAPAYWARHGKPCRPEELSGHNCLVLARKGDPQSIWRFRDGEASLPVHVSGDRMTNDGGLLRHWAISGAGVVLKTDYDIAADLRAGRLETALDAFKQEDINIYAVHASGQHLSRRAQAFMEYLAEMC